MFFSTTARKTIIGVAITLPLALAACSHSDDEAEPTSTSTMTSTKAATSVSKAPEKKKEEAEKPEESKPEESPAPESPGQPIDPIPDPSAALENLPKLQPVDGEPANPELVAQMRSMVEGITSQTSGHALSKLTINNSCQAIIDQLLEQSPANSRQELLDLVDKEPDVDLNIIPGWSGRRVTDVSEARVNGDIASAKVSVAFPGPGGEQTDTSVMRFKNEGGKWYMCN